MNYQISDAAKATPSMVDMQKFITPGQVFLTPGDAANMMGYMIDVIVSRLSDCPTLGGRVYARKNELQSRYGVSSNTMRDWLDTLEKQGRIHPLQGSPGNGKDGDVLYHIAEVDAALKDRRRACLARKDKAENKQKGNKR